MENDQTREFSVQRTIYDFKKFERKFSTDGLDSASLTGHRKPGRLDKLSALLNLKALCKVFTIFDVVQNYSVKQSLLKDVVSGLVVGLALIPQGKRLDVGKRSSPNPAHRYFTCSKPWLLVRLPRCRQSTASTQCSIHVRLSTRIPKQFRI
jgi:hypothetical protein